MGVCNAGYISRLSQRGHPRTRECVGWEAGSSRRGFPYLLSSECFPEAVRAERGRGRAVKRALSRREGGGGGFRPALRAASRRHGNAGRPPDGDALRWQRKSRPLAATADGRRGGKEGRGLAQAQVSQGAAAAISARPAVPQGVEWPVVWHVNPLPPSAAAAGGGREPASSRRRSGQEPEARISGPGARALWRAVR